MNRPCGGILHVNQNLICKGMRCAISKYVPFEEEVVKVVTKLASPVPSVVAASALATGAVSTAGISEPAGAVGSAGSPIS